MSIVLSSCLFPLCFSWTRMWWRPRSVLTCWLPTWHTTLWGRGWVIFGFVSFQIQILRTLSECNNTEICWFIKTTTEYKLDIMHNFSTIVSGSDSSPCSIVTLSNSVLQVPFREAHGLSGKAVFTAESKNIALNQLTVEDLSAIRWLLCYIIKCLTYSCCGSSFSHLVSLDRLISSFFPLHVPILPS